MCVPIGMYICARVGKEVGTVVAELSPARAHRETRPPEPRPPLQRADNLRGPCEASWPWTWPDHHPNIHPTIQSFHK